jgi:hypothetical protein
MPQLATENFLGLASCSKLSPAPPPASPCLAGAETQVLQALQLWDVLLRLFKRVQTYATACRGKSRQAADAKTPFMSAPAR